MSLPNIDRSRPPIGICNTTQVITYDWTKDWQIILNCDQIPDQLYILLASAMIP